MLKVLVWYGMDGEILKYEVECHKCHNNLNFIFRKKYIYCECEHLYKNSLKEHGFG